MYVPSLIPRQPSHSVQMQQTLRSDGRAHMLEYEYSKFVEAHAAGKLVRPTDAGHVIAALSVNASRDLSGEFISWDAEKLRAYRGS